jgi:hypothetical protein
LPTLSSPSTRPSLTVLPRLMLVLDMISGYSGILLLTSLHTRAI